MIVEKKLVRYSIKKNNLAILIYTLSRSMIAGSSVYKNNYWLKYRTEDMPKRLLFFQLYKYFPYSKVLPVQNHVPGRCFF